MKRDYLSRRQALQRAGAIGLAGAMDRLTPSVRLGWLGRRGRPALSPKRRCDRPFFLVRPSFALETGPLRPKRSTEQCPAFDPPTGRSTSYFKRDKSAEGNIVDPLAWCALPPETDGVPGVNFASIKPGDTFRYRFQVKRYGTYWYRHSPGQEQAGVMRR